MVIASLGIIGVVGGVLLNSVASKGVLAGINSALAVLYLLLVVWGVASIAAAVVSNDNGARVNAASYITIATMAHYGITFGGPLLFEETVSYPVGPELVFRALDVLVLFSVSTLLVFFINPTTLSAALIVGTGAMIIAMLGQTYKVASILQGIVSGSRDGTTGKLMSDVDE